MLDKFGKKVSPLCYFCKEEPESPIHLFQSCTKINAGRSYSILSKMY